MKSLTQNRFYFWAQLTFMRKTLSKPPHFLPDHYIGVLEMAARNYEIATDTLKKMKPPIDIFKGKPDGSLTNSGFFVLSPEDF